MRCLYCGKQLALFKKLTGGGEFCSDAHKQSYHEEYNKLALSRLMEAQTRQEEPPPRPPLVSSPVEKPAVPEPTARGGYFKQPIAIRPLGGNGVTASLAGEPVNWPIAIPASGEIGLDPGPGLAGVLMERRAVSGSGAVMAAASDFLRSGVESGGVLPSCNFEIDTTVVPSASGAVDLDIAPVAAPEAELRMEAPVAFEFAWTIPEGIDLDWIIGLEFASSEEKPVAVLPAPEPVEAEVAIEEEAEAAGVEPAQVVSVLAPASPEAVIDEAVIDEAVIPEPVIPEPVIDEPVIPEPVIDDALLFSLFGGDEVAAPAPVPSPVVEEVAEAPAAVGEAAEAIPPREPGSFLPVSIRPAGPPNKTKLMQSFQAIALVNSNPQIPAWNLLPLRPKMGIGRGSGPGAGLVDRGKTEGDTRPETEKSAATTVEVANERAAEEIAAPTFGVNTKSRTGLSRWFKLTILVGVLGIAGSAFEPAGATIAGARQHMTTEFAVCRN